MQSDAPNGLAAGFFYCKVQVAFDAAAARGANLHFVSRIQTDSSDLIAVRGRQEEAIKQQLMEMGTAS